MLVPIAELLPYKLLYKYPGMRPKDEIIWDRFIQTHPGLFDSCFYNVPVGDPAVTDRLREEMMFNGAYGVSQWRVDVVGVRDGKNYVIEVKPHADTHSIGEVMAYRALLIGEGRISPDSEAMIITDDISPIMAQACAQLGINAQQA